ncbi:MAG: bifunctional homocysteine S-methyltransferase/methylenetetrahydrofolate reductase, partial [Anaerolinea sp.]|nr:bifunctional homocysteine S-methyltransferase/methylenetetrahydrofolate reductase [Anaerolinea sp.]
MTLLSDGAMGTVLHSRGIDFEQCFDELNLTNPAVVAEIHRGYIDAGSQMIQTNTFGANRYKLAKHGLEDRVREINRAGVELAKKVVGASFKDILIAGDVGPLGVRIAPFGRVKLEQAREAFVEQISVLVESGVDLLILETFSDLYEIQEGIAAAREVNPHIPVIASMTFTRDDLTLLGDNPSKVAKTMHAAGADILGVNCSGGPAQILRILKAMRHAVPEGIFSVMPNAGWPEQVGGRIKYPAAPEYFGDYAAAFRNAGATVIGGCCGTTPEHITYMRSALDKAPVPDLKIMKDGIAEEEAGETADKELPTLFAQKLAAGKFVTAVEMDPPRGLSTHKLLAGASLLAEAGVDVIDVADSPMARMRMSPWAVCSLIQKQTNVETTLHFPTRGRNMLRVQGDLLAAHALNIRNVFVVMGDPTAIGDYPEAMDNYDLVPSGLIKLIKQGFNEGVDHAGSEIGQPTTFFVGCALNLAAANRENEIKNLQRKLQAGVDFILTQPVFDTSVADAFLDSYRAQHGDIPVPLLMGVLPLNNPRH